MLKFIQANINRVFIGVIQLIDDLGNVLGCGGLLENLRRLNIAKADISTAHSIEEVSKDWRKYLLPVSEINKWL